MDQRGLRFGITLWARCAPDKRCVMHKNFWERILTLSMGLALLIAAGCATAERPVGPAGSIYCETDADCQKYDPTWLCDLSLHVCIDRNGEVPESDGDVEEEATCTYTCGTSQDCEQQGLQGYICSSYCCVPLSTDGDYEESIPREAIISYTDPVNFGSVLIGHMVCKDVTIRNTGVTPLTIYGVTYQPNVFTPEYTLINLPDAINPTVVSDEHFITLAPGSEPIAFQVCYNPADAGIDLAEIYVTSDATNEPNATIHLVSDYKGNCSVCWSAVFDEVAPEEATIDHDINLIDFGDIDVGGEPASAYIKLWNCGDATGNHVLSITDIRLSGIDTSYTLRMDNDPNPVDPIQLPPKGAVEPTEANGSVENVDWVIAKVAYAPVSQIQWPRLHSEHLEILNDSSEADQRMYVIDMQGSAQNMIIEGYPNPIYCGPTPYFDPDTNEPGEDICFIDIQNRSPNEMLITGIDIFIPVFGIPQEDQPNPSSFAMVNPMTNVTLPGNQVQPSHVEFYYRPEPRYEDPNDHTSLMIPRNDRGTLRVTWCKTSNPECRPDSPTLGNQTTSSLFQIFAKGMPPNIPPVARVSLMSHGPQITQPLYDQKCGESYKAMLWGDTSYDRDSQSTLCGMQWEWEEDYGERAKISPTALGMEHLMDFAQSAYFSFSESGTYRVRLHVWDCDPPLEPLNLNASEAARLSRREAINENLDNLAEFHVVCEAGLILRMHYGGCDGKAQVDLIWKSPNGISCSEATMNAMHTCSMGDYGAAIVSSYATQCMDGTYEEITHAKPTDGTYMVCAKLKEDCDHWGFNLFGEELCLDKAHPDFTIGMYELVMQNGSPVVASSPKYTVTGHLGSQGDMKCWNIRRENGGWGNPPTSAF